MVVDVPSTQFSDISPSSYREDIVSFINYLERKYPVNELTGSGVHLWPLLRRIIAAEKENIVLGYRFPPRYAKDAKLEKVQNDLLKSYEGSFGNVYDDPLSVFNRAAPPPETGRLSLEDVSNVDILFYSRPSRYLEQDISGYFVNIDVDAEYALFAKFMKVGKFEIENPKTINTLPRKIPTALRNADPVQAGRKKSPATKAERQRYLAFRDSVIKLEGVPANILPEPAALFDHVNFIYEAKEMFLPVLRTINPKAVAVSLYFDTGERTMSLIWACKELGIPTFELQHGLIGAQHWAFTHWSNIPSGGYDLIPDYFWIWDEATKSVLMNSNLGVGNRHCMKPLLAKNFKIASLIAEHDATRPNARARNLRTIAGSYEKTILFSAQYGLGVTPAILFKAMRKGPKDWLWLIRLHPLARPLVPYWHKLLEQEAIDNYELELCNSVSLLECLNLADHVVTSFSTTGFEAMALGLSCTVVTNLGYQAYEPYIRSGNILFASTVDRLLSSIAEGETVKAKGLLPQSEAEIKNAYDAMLTDFAQT